MASFVLSFFPLDVLDEIWDFIESVFEVFLTYSFYLTFHKLFTIPYDMGLTAGRQDFNNLESSLVAHELDLAKIVFHVFFHEA